MSLGGWPITLWGLSPRVRGNPRPRPHIPASFGSIPACAGEPMPVRGWCSTPRVYPRVCGGTFEGKPVATCKAGLSPRVRGEPQARCVGISRHRVYPRVCGGTPWVGICQTLRAGLSPRVRGNPKHPEHCGREIGSIPACAGEPRIPRCWFCRWRVYPRVCGGTVRPPCPPRQGEGLSPRVRGNPIRSATW